ncbi:serine/threonine-protein phosphatase 7 long form homolog [Gossypium hirsutum]|uniref:Serine/threonine-protein phosphatase 7 long form homolog n=1 Tax=Gossypium hirsutum TaxID=3635 RepID=A0ABM2YHM2_GOSHI|nr:serine/threonine-protein phosphatase 7 long form homolog [Gossypium hirsutum]
MASLINKDLAYICDTVNNMVKYCYLLITGLVPVLRGQVNGLGYSPDARLMPYLELAGFELAALTRTFDLRYDLISALVKRWRPETHTFHLPCGECTVTLEDVALQFGLPIDRNAVMGVSAIAESAALCYSLLRASPGDDESNFSELKFTWLKANFEHLSVNAIEEELIWGSTVLAMLYHKLCRTTKPNAVDIGGCLVLLQSWAFYRMSFLASFIWMPYRRPEIAAIIPSSAYVHSQSWCTNAPIISFNVVEWYHGDQVLRQFGCIQYIPDLPIQVGKVHSINKRGKHGIHWGVVHRNLLRCGISDGSKTSDGYVFRFATIVRVHTMVL